VVVGCLDLAVDYSTADVAVIAAVVDCAFVVPLAAHCHYAHNTAVVVD